MNIVGQSRRLHSGLTPSAISLIGVQNENDNIVFGFRSLLLPDK